MQFEIVPRPPLMIGQTVRFGFSLDDTDTTGTYAFKVLRLDEDGAHEVERFDVGMPDRTTVIERMFIPADPGTYQLKHQLRDLDQGDTEHDENPEDVNFGEIIDYEFGVVPFQDAIHKVSLVAREAQNSVQTDLWAFIENASMDLRFEKFVESFQAARPVRPVGLKLAHGFGQPGGPDNPAYGMPTYDHLHRLSTEFVLKAALGEGDDGSELSYVTDRSEKAKATNPYPDDIKAVLFPLKSTPFIELIYVYWLEEAMLFQSLNRIIARFRNRRIDRTSDPLARLAVSPLLPLRGLLWGLSEAERYRLSVHRRDDEYGYEYGLKLIGKAVPPPEQSVERRTQFLPAFHALLNAAHHYYKERDDLTIQADAFPLLNSLRELHLVLAQGANNQFADLPLTARSETIEVQWMLAQPEMQQFLGGRTMVPYAEEWMDRVDTMKSLYGWSDVSVTHFFDLAVHGERLVLSVRHGDWNDTMSTMGAGDAENWAMHWRNSVQRYIHAYRAVTGVDLAQRVDTTMPSTLLSRRMAKQLV